MKKSNIFLSFILTVFFCIIHYNTSGQTATVKGKIVDSQNKPIADVVVQQEGTSFSTLSGEKGEYLLIIPVSNPKIIKISFNIATYEMSVLELEIKSGYVYDQPIKLRSLTSEEIIIKDKKTNRPQMQVIPINIEEVTKIPTVNPSVEGLLLSQPGVSNNSEFSSQYRVRGGNFDENLVYVNGIEVYRPFLVRSGQMEGLGFANRNMTENIAFSTGGFPAQYGDKMSSVLDITYRTPKSFRGSAEIGAITNSLHLEGISKNKKNPEAPGKFTYLMGARFFTLTYLLNSLEVRGNYRPYFADLQGMFTYTPKREYKSEKIITLKDGKQDTIFYPLEKWKYTAFFTGAKNQYKFTPTYGESSFGTVQQAYRLLTAFEGLEVTGYTTFSGSVVAENRPNTRWKMQHILSAFRTEESEKFDVEGGYRLSELNTNFGSEEFGNESFTLGTGSIFRHGRNYLTVSVLAAETKGEWTNKNQYNHKIFWGGKYEHHFVTDELKEYNLYDSAQYIIDPKSQFDVTEYLKGTTTFGRNILRFYLQEEWLFGKNQAASLTYGMRMTYDDKIKLLMPAPRAQFSYDFGKINPDKQLRIRFATGVYHQPPFYREFRRHDGSLNTNLTPQTSIHLISGLDYTFNAWGRDFILYSEAYYKYLYNIIPYEVQNVRIRYYPDYQLPGYAYGLDARLSGEFIKGVDSWISASYLKTQERKSDTIPTMIARPADQRFTLSMFFQDELPINPTYKVHLNYVFGSGTRAGVPRNFLNRTVLGYPSYNRVDIGFSKMIIYKTSDQLRDKKHAVSSLWATLEIFNLFGRFNTVGYEWVKDLDNRWFAVPQHLSARLINLRAVIHFR